MYEIFITILYCVYNIGAIIATGQHNILLHVYVSNSKSNSHTFATNSRHLFQLHAKGHSHNPPWILFQVI